jgi:hypothetical protein
VAKEDTKKTSFLSRLIERIAAWMIAWLLQERKRTSPPLQDFKEMCDALQQADVLLFRGRARVSRVISFITQSQWTHAALYIGRCSDFNHDSPTLALIRQFYDGDEHEQLVVESLLGQGTTISPLSMYHDESIRLSRPHGLLKEDAGLVVEYAVKQVGREYDIRQLFDLARFVFPYALLPRRWLSSLFNFKAGAATKAVCSTVLVESFMQVQFPVTPVIHQVGPTVAVYRRNPRLVTPADFDYSPYFEIIKFPHLKYSKTFLGISTKGGYRELPWKEEVDTYCNNNDDCFVSETDGVSAIKIGEKE